MFKHLTCHHSITLKLSFKYTQRLPFHKQSYSFLTLMIAFFWFVLTDADYFEYPSLIRKTLFYIAKISVSVGFNALLIAPVVFVLWYCDS